MQTTVETIDKFSRKLRVELPDASLNSEIENRLQSKARTVKLSGFRVGKVPMHMIERHYGEQIKAEVIDDKIRDSLYQVLHQKKLRPIAQPIIDEINQTDQGLSYIASFDIYPEITLTPLDQLQLEKPRADIADPEIDQMVEVLRRRHRTFVEVNRPAEDGDILEMDIEGVIEGESLPLSKAEKHQFELGRDRLFNGIEADLSGYSAGEKITLSGTLPEDYGIPEQRGKKVELTIYIHVVKQATLPDLDETFFTQFGLPENTLVALRQAALDNMRREVEFTIREMFKHATFNALEQANQIELPNALVEQETEHLHAQLIQRLKQQGGDIKGAEEVDRSTLNAEAEKRIRLRLLVGEIIAANEIKPDQSRVNALIKQIASAYEKAIEIEKQYRTNRDKIAQIESMVLEDQVLEHIEAHAKITEKPYSFDEIMNKRQTL